MKEIIDEYDAPYGGFDLTHGEFLKKYTAKKLASGDYEIFVQAGNRVTGGFFTRTLRHDDISGKTYREIVDTMPLGGLLEELLLSDEKMKRFFGFS